MLGDVLRDYQRRGLDFLAYLAGFGFGGILADDMGLGKTITTLAYFKWRKKMEGQAPSLVVAPTSVTHTWENEIARFAPDLTTLRLQSGSDRAQKFETMKDFDVVITSYALARLDAEALAKHRFRTLVLDEAQSAKNPSSQIAKVVRALQADHRIALTGTPVENSLRDLWAIFSFLEPGLLGSEGSFRRRFEVPIADGDARAVTALRSRLEPFVLRRTKEDVARELPERTEVLLECDLTPTQLRMYRAIAEAARRDVLSQIGPNGMEGAAVHVLAALTRLRQVCAHPALLVDSYGDAAEVSGKFDAFLETIDEILSGNHRVLVFSAFASMLRLMRRHFEKTGLVFGYLDGSTKDRDRRDEVERFMQPDGPPVFLCSLKAGGVGLKLTAADYVILYDPWWNPAIERQAIDRTHRIGQHRAVLRGGGAPTGEKAARWKALRDEWRRLSADGAASEPAWEDLWRRVHRLRREIVFANPAGQRGPAGVRQAGARACSATSSRSTTAAVPGRAAACSCSTRPGRSMQLPAAGRRALPAGKLPAPRRLVRRRARSSSPTATPRPRRRDRESHLDRFYHLYEMAADGIGPAAADRRRRTTTSPRATCPTGRSCSSPRGAAGSTAAGGARARSTRWPWPMPTAPTRTRSPTTRRTSGTRRCWTTAA